MAAPAYRASALATPAASGSITLTVPNTVEVNDVMLILSVGESTSTMGTMSTPTESGQTWTEVDEQQATKVSYNPSVRASLSWRRVASTSERGNTVTLAHSGFTGEGNAVSLFHGMLIAYSGCDTSGNPWDAVVATTNVETDYHYFNAVTVSGSERTLLGLWCEGDNTGLTSGPTNYTQRVLDQSTTSIDGSVGAWDYANRSSDGQVYIDGNWTTETGVTFHISLKPVPSGLQAYGRAAITSAQAKGQATLAQAAYGRSPCTSGQTKAYGATNSKCFGRAAVTSGQTKAQSTLAQASYGRASIASGQAKAHAAVRLCFGRAASSIAVNRDIWKALVGTDGELEGFSFTTANGWAGDGSSGDPYRLVFNNDDSSYVDLGGVTPASDKSFSVEVWIVAGTQGVSANYLMQGDEGNGTTSPLVALNYNASAFTLQMRDDTASNVTITGTTNPTAGSIYHVVGTCNGSTMTLYVNSSSEGTPAAPPAGTFSLDKATLGRRVNTPLILNNGQGVVAARMYDHALSSDEVTAHYNLGVLAQSGFKSTGLVASYIAALAAGAGPQSNSVTAKALATLEAPVVLNAYGRASVTSAQVKAQSTLAQASYGRAAAVSGQVKAYGATNTKCFGRASAAFGQVKAWSTLAQAAYGRAAITFGQVKADPFMIPLQAFGRSPCTSGQVKAHSSLAIASFGRSPCTSGQVKAYGATNSKCFGRASIQSGQTKAQSTLAQAAYGRASGQSGQTKAEATLVAGQTPLPAYGRAAVTSGQNKAYAQPVLAAFGRASATSGQVKAHAAVRQCFGRASITSAQVKADARLVLPAFGRASITSGQVKADPFMVPLQAFGRASATSGQTKAQSTLAQASYGRAAVTSATIKGHATLTSAGAIACYGRASVTSDQTKGHATIIGALMTFGRDCVITSTATGTAHLHMVVIPHEPSPLDVTPRPSSIGFVGRDRAEVRPTQAQVERRYPTVRREGRTMPPTK